MRQDAYPQAQPARPQSAQLSRFATPLMSMILAIHRWSECRKTKRVLQSLDARFLRDIGIDREDIDRVAESNHWPHGR